MSSRTIINSLTTTFTPPVTCTIPVIACPTCNYGWAAQTCHTSVEDNTACWPSTSSGFLPSPTQPLWGWGFYSPGLICPKGYTSACTATATATTLGTWTPQWVMDAGETAVGCCPRYAYQNPSYFASRFLFVHWNIWKKADSQTADIHAPLTRKGLTPVASSPRPPASWSQPASPEPPPQHQLSPSHSLSLEGLKKTTSLFTRH